ncbi:MAG TPA: hypothetical protein VGR19_07410 [Allosphingosinicella sp.]|nr:hypothetical protein [Allosphingosinicella sp.]
MELKRAGVRDSDISMLHQDSDKHRSTEHHDHDRDHDDSDNKGSGAAKGAGIGAGVGALAGLAALAIPGIGPFVALGAVAETLGVIGSAAATSAVVGAAAGGIAGAMMDYGVSEEDARYYDKRVREGDVWVGVDTTSSAVDPVTVQRILKDAGGESAEFARAAAY